MAHYCPPQTCKIYQQLKASRDNNGVAYISVAQTASLIRRQLKDHFPSSKFQVISKNNKIEVYWTGEPTRQAVQHITRDYSFGGFDSTIDLAHSGKNWLMPNGSMCKADWQGTTSSRGCVQPTCTDPPTPNAIIVSGGPTYVFLNDD